jgi:hypothetical protein
MAETKAQIEERYQARLAQIEEELAAQRELAQHYREELEADRSDPDEELFDESEAKMLYDPYDSKNPFKVIGHIQPNDEYPEGAIVAWKSPSYRARRQWRGWTPFTYGDRYTGKNGEDLTNYIPDPPPSIDHEGLDNYVRRGDVVLARLDRRIFESRQQKRIMESNRNQGKAGSRAKTVLGDGVEIVGQGVSKSPRPRGGFRPEQESAPLAPGAHRSTHPTTNSEES